MPITIKDKYKMLRLTFSDDHGLHTELYAVEYIDYVKTRVKHLKKKGWKVNYAHTN